MNILNRILILLCLFGLNKCYPQDSSYFTKWYSADSNHLPQNSVKSIVKDKYNFLWLSTESGLIRFDGENFKTYNSSVTPNSKSDRMYLFGGSVEKDSITIINGLFQLFVIHNRDVKMETAHLSPPIKPKNDLELWSLEFRQGLHYTNENRLFSFSSGKKSYIIGNDSIREYEKNYILKDKYPFALTNGLQFFSISGKLYLMGKENTYYQVDKSGKKAFNFINTPAAPYTVYTNEPCKQVFLVSGKNLYLVKQKKSGLTTELLYNGFDIEDNIKSVFYDKKNNILYLGSSNKGLLVIKKRDFITIDSPTKMNNGIDGVYYGLIPFGKNKILASTGSVFENKTYSGYIPIGKQNDKYVIVIDNNEDIWVKGYVNLYRFTKDSGYKKYDKWTLDNYIATIHKSPDGKIWISTTHIVNNQQYGSIYVLNPEDKEAKPKLYKKVKKGVISFFSINNDELWMGCSDGLLKLNTKKNTIKTIPELEGTHIRSIYASKDNELWLASYNKGLFLYKDGVVTNFPTDKDKHLLSTHCIIEDKNGFFWITTNRGLFRVKKQDLYDYASGKKKNVYYYYYNKNSGFATNEFNGGCYPCGAYLNNEEIFFPSMNGIVYFKPSDVEIKEPNNDIFIDKVEIDNKLVNTTNLKIDRNFNRIKFYVYSPFYGNAYNQNIETQLSGPVSQNWASLTGDYVDLSTLPPGKYRLKARKLSGWGSNYIYKEINFEVTPAFWQTIWFNVLIGIIGCIILVFMFKMRLRYINYKNEILEQQVAIRTKQLGNTIKTLRKTKISLSKQNENHKRLIKNITHDIKSPLKFIAITGHYVYNNLSGANEIYKEDIESIYTSSSQLYYFVDSFLEYTKQADNDMKNTPSLLKEVIKEKIIFFKNIANSRKIEIIDTTEHNTIVGVNRHLLSIVLHNLLDNAIKNTNDGTIALKTIVKDEEIILTINDSGKGMSKEQVIKYNQIINQKADNLEYFNNGMGLQIIAELLVIMDVKMTVLSEEGIGTEVTLYLR